jgi:ABC-type amino acid transport substrate-binding protein
MNNSCNLVKNVFNKRLAKLIDDGTYEKLLEKWGLVL